MAIEKYCVIAQFLNLRSAPVVGRNNIITRLAYQQVVEMVGPGLDWHRIVVNLRSQTIEGYVSAKWIALLPAADIPPQPLTTVPPEVHFSGNTNSRRDSTLQRHIRLNEAPMPGIDLLQKVQSIHQILRYLDVERSARYRRTQFSTYCNIYAYDFCCLTNAYLPRVWWKSKALLAFARGEQVEIIYGETVRELNANSLFEWLKEWGNDYGWVRTYNLNDLQNEVNKGKPGLICAQRLDLNRSGHIVCVVPEAGTLSATHVGGSVAIPLQSQAGARNKMFFNNRDWWLGPEFRDFGFWYQEI